MLRLGKISNNWQCFGFFSYIAPHVGSGCYLGSPYIFDCYSSGERTSLLCTDVRLEYKSEGRPGVILGSPCSFLSESTEVVFHSCKVSLVALRVSRFCATCYGMRQSSVYSHRVELWIMLFVFAGCVFCRVSGHLAGGCLGSWRAPPWFFAVASFPWSKNCFS